MFWVKHTSNRGSGAEDGQEATSSKGSNRSFVHSSSFIGYSPGVKLGANTPPAAHVQPIRDLLNRQGGFPSQSRRQRQFPRNDLGSLAQKGVS